ncbi:hypothetical protein FQR65_LT04948 [Abscondita terminalis]|nr:hypothetical protein FQR65_LT04948 [Abscondita terminalis]
MEDSSDQRTVWCGNLSEKISEEVLYELFLQAAPLERVHIPKDKSGKCNSYAFVTFKHLCSVQYATDLLNGISLYNKKIVIKPRQKPGDTQQPPQPCTLLYTPPSVQLLQNMEDIHFLNQLGNQLLLNNNARHFPHDYRNDRSSSNARGGPNYERRDEQRSYKRQDIIVTKL